MPDRYDPKLSVRPLSERRHDPAAADDDPLAELARIVTGRSTYDPGPGSKIKTEAAPESSEETDLGRDLESELLNELQAAFAAVREPFDSSPSPPPSERSADETPPPERLVRNSAPAPAPPVEPARPEPASGRVASADVPSLEELLSGLAESLAPEEERNPPPPAPAMSPPLPEPPAPSAPFPPVARTQPPVPPSRPIAAPEPPPEPSGPRPPPPTLLRRPVAVERPGAVERPVAPDRPPVAERYVEPERPTIADRPSPPDRPMAPERPVVREPPMAPERAAAERPDVSRLRIRPAPPMAPPDEDEAPMVPPPPQDTRWQRADQHPPQPPHPPRRPPEGLSRFAPPRAAAQIRPPPSAPEPEIEPEDAVEFAGEPVEDADVGFDDAFTLEDLDAAAYAPEDDLPPFPEEELASLKRRRSGRAFAAVGAVLIIVAAGAAAVFLFRGDGSVSSPPPIIAADATPTKVAPAEQPANESDQQSKLIYDRVDNGDGGDQTTLVTNGDEAIAQIPPVDEETSNNAITRVIIPGGPGIDGPMGDTGDAAAAGDGSVTGEPPPAPESDTLGPKKVRTVVVRPDGTIVSSEAVDEGANAAPDEGAASGDASDIALPTPAPSTRTDMDEVLDGNKDLSVNPDPLGVTNPDNSPDDMASPPPGTVPAGDQTTEVIVAETPAPAEPAVTPDPPRKITPPPAKAAAPATVASTGGSGPINLTPGTSTQSSGPHVAAGGVLVQVSAQRSEDAARASYRGLQSRYPNILGPYQAAIIRADLGDRGIYFRVRIGPFSSSDATRLCDDLKAAGGDCLLAR